MKKFLKQYEPLLGANDYSFLERVYSTDPGIYRNRIRAIAFEGKERVLDAGCGFGQWTNVFAKLNQEVHACDISGIRLAICRDMASYFGHRNVFVRHSSLEKTPYESEFFEAVFCFSTIFISNNPFQVLREFYRILKPGGKLYVNANGLGWTLNLWLNSPNTNADYDPRTLAAKAFQNTVNFKNGLPKGDGQIIIEKEEFIAESQRIGYRNIICQAEGTINISKDKLEIKPFFKDQYYGFTGVYEVLAEK